MKHKTGCVYLITNLHNGKCYVGQTVKPLARRWYEHVKAAECGKRFYLHNAIRYYGGAGSFSIKSIWNGVVSKLSEMEQKFIVDLKTRAPHGYNLTAGGEGASNPSAKSRRKMSAAHLGVPCPAAVKAAVSAARKGKPLEAEHCAKVSKSNKHFWKKMPVDAQQAKIAKLHTPESIMKREATLKASGAHVGGPEKARKCSETSKARWADEEYHAQQCVSQRKSWRGRKGARRRASQIAHQTGQIRGSDARANIAAGAVRGWETRRRNALKSGV